MTGGLQCTCAHGAATIGAFPHAAGCPWYSPPQPVQWQTWTGTVKLPPDPPRLHQEDVERIAKRVAELLKETP